MWRLRFIRCHRFVPKIKFLTGLPLWPNACIGMSGRSKKQLMSCQIWHDHLQVNIYYICSIKVKLSVVMPCNCNLSHIILQITYLELLSPLKLNWFFWYLFKSLALKYKIYLGGMPLPTFKCNFFVKNFSNITLTNMFKHPVHSFKTLLTLVSCTSFNKAQPFLMSNKIPFYHSKYYLKVE